MQTLNKIKVGFIAVLIAGLTSCTKERRVKYEVVNQQANDIILDKNKAKTDRQYISILYANLFQEALPINKQVSTQNVIQSVGDRSLVFEIILSNYMNESGTVLPSVADMKANTEQFIIDTYKRFYLRIPTELEKSFFINYFQSNPNVTPELVYTAFAASDEYIFY
jgi:hypothetical protein